MGDHQHDDVAAEDCCKWARENGELCRHDYPELAAFAVWRRPDVTHGSEIPPAAADPDLQTRV